MSAPLVVNTRDGACWTRRTVTEGGVALYALADVCSCPEFVMATLPELAERGIVGSADALPMPVGPAPRTEVERLAKQVVELQHELREARFDAACARRERDVIRERVSEPYGCAHCGVTKRSHGRRYVSGAGMHGWERPSEEQVKDRMLARRAARVPVVPELQSYPPALPWARLMDHEDLTEFLDELAASAITHAPAERALTEVEATCGRWRLIAEAQHAHNTAPGPDAEAGEPS
ncbi:hypothetical protein ACFW34_11830 [Streptomyces sp. NPDC058848]|uniref:hypothetical protein n=1 Tax=unclassified Streptomyces TaxID=2593676 RepID=UPI00368C0639